MGFFQAFDGSKPSDASLVFSICELNDFLGCYFQRIQCFNKKKYCPRVVVQVVLKFNLIEQFDFVAPEF